MKRNRLPLHVLERIRRDRAAAREWNRVRRQNAGIRPPLTRAETEQEVMQREVIAAYLAGDLTADEYSAALARLAQSNPPPF